MECSNHLAQAGGSYTPFVEVVSVIIMNNNCAVTYTVIPYIDKFLYTFTAFIVNFLRIPSGCLW